MKLERHTFAVTSVSFSPDGSRIVSGSGDNSMRVWDSHTGAELTRLEGHTYWVTSVSFSPDGSRIVSGSYDETVRVWDVPPPPPPPMVVPPDEDDYCVICMEGLRDTSNGYVVQLICGHYFHANCIKGWQNAGESTSEGYEEGVSFLQSGYQMPGKKCPICRHLATDNTYADGILRLRF